MNSEGCLTSQEFPLQLSVIVEVNHYIKFQWKKTADDLTDKKYESLSL